MKGIHIMKQRLIKFLSIILSLFMITGILFPAADVEAAEQFGIVIDVSDGDQSGNGWTYYSEYYNLVLENYRGGGIKINDTQGYGVEITLLGTNVITVGNIQENNMAAGVYSEGSVYFDGDGSLTIDMNCGGLTGSDVTVVGIYGGGQVNTYLPKNTLTINITAATNYYGLYAGEDYFIEGPLTVNISGNNHTGAAMYEQSGYFDVQGEHGEDIVNVNINYKGKSSRYNAAIAHGSQQANSELYLTSAKTVITAPDGNYSDLTGIHIHSNSEDSTFFVIRDASVTMTGVTDGIVVDDMAYSSYDIQFDVGSFLDINSSHYGIYCSNRGLMIADADLTIHSGEACIRGNHENTETTMDIRGICSIDLTSDRDYAVDLRELKPDTYFESHIELDEGGQVRFRTNSTDPDHQKYVVSEFFDLRTGSRPTKGSLDPDLASRNGYGAPAFNGDGKEVIIRYDTDAVRPIRRVDITSRVSPEYGLNMSYDAFNMTTDPALPSGSYYFNGEFRSEDGSTSYYSSAKIPAGRLGEVFNIFINEGNGMVFTDQTEFYIDNERFFPDYIEMQSVELTKMVDIVKPDNAPPVITTGSLPPGVTSEEYTYQMEAQGDGDIKWSLVYPVEGVSISEDGLLSVTAGSRVDEMVGIAAENAYGYDTRQLYLDIDDNTPVKRLDLSSTNLSEPELGKQYTFPYNSFSADPYEASPSVRINSINWTYHKGTRFINYDSRMKYKAGLNRLLVSASITGSIYSFTNNTEVYLDGEKLEVKVTNARTLEAYRDVTLKAAATRIAGSNRSLTSIESSKYIEKLKKENNPNSRLYTVIVATAMEYPDALTGAYLSRSYGNAPILLIRQKNINDIVNYINNSLSRGSVIVLGGEKAVPNEWLSGLNSTIRVRRVQGSNRYGTNIEILKEGNFVGGDILVCVGKSVNASGVDTAYADALSASATGQPILLVDKGGLKANQKEYLSSFRGKLRFHIIGGTSAVTEVVEQELKNYGIVKERLAGKNRYETSVLIAQRFFDVDHNSSALLAYGDDFPDGLSGGPLGLNLRSPLILVNEKRKDIARNFLEHAAIHNGYVLGGESVVPSERAAYIFGLDSPADVIPLQ